MIWFGVSASISAPALTKMRRASATNALKARSLMMTTCTFCFCSPAVFSSGWVYSRSSCSISASRMSGMPCACAGGALAITSAAAVTIATARHAGVERFALVGLRASIISGKGSLFVCAQG